MKCLIVNYNRLTLLKNTIDWADAHGLDVIIVDNNSDYPPLLKYYAECPYVVIQLGQNYGHTVVWQRDIMGMLGAHGERYIVTDPDLDLSGVPDNFLTVLNRGLDRHKSYSKCALSLEINDLPDSPEGNYIRSHEAKYWTKPLDEDYLHADTDTTFALYREGCNIYTHSAIRTNRPYTARHLPWYYIDFTTLPEDEQNYYRTANESCSHKKRL